jgi:hypothetical protein
MQNTQGKVLGVPAIWLLLLLLLLLLVVVVQ